MNRFGIKGMTPTINFVDGTVDSALGPLHDEENFYEVPYGPGLQYGNPNFIDLGDSRLVLPSTGIAHFGTLADRMVNRFGVVAGAGLGSINHPR